jgi:hypothetical protein
MTTRPVPDFILERVPALAAAAVVLLVVVGRGPREGEGLTDDAVDVVTLKGLTPALALYAPRPDGPAELLPSLFAGSLSALLVALAASPAIASVDDAGAAAPEPRRIAVVIARNDGGPDRALLRYAHSDAQAFADVLTDLGGVPPSDVRLVMEPDRARLFASLDDARAIAAHSAGRTEVIIYYSGHSDARGLILGGDLVPYEELKVAIQAIHADVRVVVLDSCASGASTQLKGGVRRPALVVDDALAVQGTAVLTSSSADEAAQESERLRGSFSTHALITGLRGAGDVSGDGRVTLTEAYQFAFADTLARTERTSGGAQHAAFNIRLSGTGDLVMTDLRTTSSTLVLAPALAGRVFVRDTHGVLAAELTKLPGLAVPLALPAGHYDVVVQDAGGVRQGGVELGVSAVHLEDRGLRSVDVERTVRRGLDDLPSVPLFLGAAGMLAAGAVGAVGLAGVALVVDHNASNPDGGAELRFSSLDVLLPLQGGGDIDVHMACDTGVGSLLEADAVVAEPAQAVITSFLSNPGELDATGGDVDVCWSTTGSTGCFLVVEPLDLSAATTFFLAANGRLSDTDPLLALDRPSRAPHLLRRSRPGRREHRHPRGADHPRLRRVPVRADCAR